MAAIQLNFSLRTSANCKTVHLLGSWDNYAGQLPLSKDSAKAGSWKGAFRFQSTMIKQGQRYWYYYILDGYHVSHDPAREHTVEPTTGRKLNILDVPTSSTSATSTHRKRSSTQSIAKGRPLSPGRIVSPQPFKPGMTQHLIATGQNTTYDQLAAQFNQVQISDDDDDESSDEDSDAGSDVPSLTSSRSSRSSASSSSRSSSVSSCCTCERFGITRSGNRVRLDCGGSRCGYSSGDESSECASDSENETYRVQQTRRQGDEKGKPLPTKRPMLRIYTRFKLDPDDDTASLNSFLHKRYKELAPSLMPPHLHSPENKVPSLTPALVEFPARGRTEMSPGGIMETRPPESHTPFVGWKPRSHRASKPQAGTCSLL